MKIDVNNYFLHSMGDFKVQPTSWAEKCMEALKTDGQYAVKLGNRKWIPNFISENRYGSFSAYWVSEDNQWLLRVSDHWSSAPDQRNGDTTECGSIRHCWWRILGRRQAPYTQFLSSGKGILAGVVRLSDMKDIG